MKIVCISDTHADHRKVDVPDGDILLHAGDLTHRGELSIVKDFNDWMGTLPHKHKIVIAGNHDFCFENHNSDSVKAKKLMTNCTYLQDESVTVEGIKIYGTPWQPWFYDWAFNLRRGDQCARKWEQIPEDADILVVHGPPYGHGDRTMSNELVGGVQLLERIQALNLKLVVTGHIHEGYGLTREGNTAIANASICTHRYDPVNPPIVFDYESGKMISPLSYGE